MTAKKPTKRKARTESDRTRKRRATKAEPVKARSWAPRLGTSFAETVPSMGDPAEWRIEPPPDPAIGRHTGAPPPVDDGPRAATLRDFPFRKGYAWAAGTNAGHVLHCALCRSMGVDPETYGLTTELGSRLDMSKQHYYRLVREGWVETVIRAATRLGLYAIQLPPATPEGPIRWVIGDVPTEVAP